VISGTMVGAPTLALLVFRESRGNVKADLLEPRCERIAEPDIAGDIPVDGMAG
jgi:hypothetical protein